MVAAPYMPASLGHNGPAGAGEASARMPPAHESEHHEDRSRHRRSRRRRRRGRRGDCVLRRARQAPHGRDRAAPRARDAVDGGGNGRLPRPVRQPGRDGDRARGDRALRALRRGRRASRLRHRPPHPGLRVGRHRGARRGATARAGHAASAVGADRRRGAERRSRRAAPAYLGPNVIRRGTAPATAGSIRVASTHGYAPRATAAFACQTTALGIERRGPRQPASRPSAGRIATTSRRRGRAFSGVVAKWAGVELPLTLLRRHHLVIPDVPRRPRTPMTIDDGARAHWRPALGGAHVMWTQSPATPTEPLEDVPPCEDFAFDVLSPRSPRFGRAHLSVLAISVGCWQARGSCARASTTSPRSPSAARRDAGRGLYVNAGYSGHGVSGERGRAGSSSTSPAPSATITRSGSNARSRRVSLTCCSEASATSSILSATRRPASRPERSTPQLRALVVGHAGEVGERHRLRDPPRAP